MKIESLFDSIFVPDFTFPGFPDGDEVPELCLRLKTGCEIRFKRSKRRNVEKVVTIREFYLQKVVDNKFISALMSLEANYFTALLTPKQAQIT